MEKIRLLIFQGSPRNEDNCPNEDNKTSYFIDGAIKLLLKNFDNIIIDYCDLSLNDKKSIIQPCKGCVSTAGGAHCHFPCDCYIKDDDIHPDLMHDDNIYKRLAQCDGFALFTPIHWYSVPSQVKALFDRLVCINLTTANSKYQFKKDSEVTKKLEKNLEFRKELKNHLEGRFAAFYIHGDDGANDYVHEEKPQSLLFDDDKKSVFSKAYSAIMPLVLQCRYSGVYVPNELITSFYINKKKFYGEANDLSIDNEKAIVLGYKLLMKLVKNIENFNKKSSKYKTVFPYRKDYI